MKLKEKDIENQILVWLNMQAGCFAFKVKTTGYYDPKTRTFRKNNSKFVIKGTSDIIGCLKGNMLAIEVKTKAGLRKYLKKPGQHEMNQHAFLDKVHEMGGIAICVSSLDEVITLLKCYLTAL